MAAAITRAGYSNVLSNKGMVDGFAATKISRSRPDWQSASGGKLAFWEMKPVSGKAALKDIAEYIAIAQSKDQVAEAGSALGLIAEGVPIDGLDGVFMDISSPEDGVIIYSAYTLQDTEKQKQTSPVGVSDKVTETGKKNVLMMIGAGALYLLINILTAGAAGS